MAEPDWLKKIPEEKYLNEDFTASGKAKYTIDGINKEDPEWLEKAAKKVHAAEGDDYVKLDAGLLTVNQLNWMLHQTLGELTFVDENNQFLWYNRPVDPDKKKLAKRVPSQVGDTMGAVHPNVRDVIPEAKKVVYALRNKVDGHTEVKMPVPNGNRHKMILHNYRRIEDDEGNYAGIYEWVQDLYPLVKYFCETTGQKLVDDPDAVSGATFKRDAQSGASIKEESPKIDSNSGASQH
ncbi:PAS domain-containing protein [Lactobacillus sp. PV034]|uniref:PAS domain-containing protein n=1 Tax=Lactobacillus sp. PV034 TaxID=2594495 RepID=UPI00223FDAB0|nr:PAS domain-containing protein [Lactobacillus sp. PV034]QNQ81310.1 oxidoreductase [Lactobacillus sp. PV034]